MRRPRICNPGIPHDIYDKVVGFAQQAGVSKVVESAIENAARMCNAIDRAGGDWDIERDRLMRTMFDCSPVVVLVYTEGTYAGICSSSG